MVRPKSQPTRVKPKPGSAGLRVRQPAEAIAALLRDRARLLKQIAKKQQELDSEREQQRVIAQTMFSRMQPLVNERSSLIEEVRTLFSELLVEGRLSRSARKKVDQIFRWLTESGEIDPIDSQRHEHPTDDADWAFDHQADFGPRGEPNADPTVNSAKHVGGRPGNDSLRGLFRRLTMALHPDLVQQGSEQERRTDVMKEVTRAYEEGNLARLIEIEELWLSGSEVRGSSLDDAAQCAELERAMRELRSQQRELQNAMRELRASSPLRAIFGRRPAGQAAQQKQIDAFLAAAAQELEPLRQIRDYVRSFSERKISLAEFLRGPATLRADEFDVAEAILQSVIGDIGFDFTVAEAPRTRSARSRGRAKGRSNDFKDCPF